jgi:hypothetical protein
MKHARTSDAAPKPSPCQGLEDERCFRFRLKRMTDGQIVYVRGVSLAEACRLLGWDYTSTHWIVQCGPHRYNPQYLSKFGWDTFGPPFSFPHTLGGG